ncbi:MAG: O-antigen ligase family protein [Candidatus Omnitrophica bacterium]|nr:O-antigen ligase family protein [Candidatus Omnitrophota bacterium]
MINKNNFLNIVIVIIFSWFVGNIVFNALFYRFKYFQFVLMGILFIPLFIALFFKHSKNMILGLIVFNLMINPGFPINFFEHRLVIYTSDFLFLFVSFFVLARSNFYKKKKIFSSSVLGGIIPLLGLAFFELLSLIPAVNKTLPWLEIIDTFRVIWLFLLAIILFDEFNDLKFVIRNLLIAFILQSCFILIEFLVGHPVFRIPAGVHIFDVVGDIFRPSGTFGHSSGFAKFSSLVIPIAFASMIYEKRKWRVISFVSFILGCFALILTVSRAGILFTSIGLFYFIFLIIIQRSFKIALPKFVLLICFFAVILSVSLGGKRIISRFNNDLGSISARPKMYSVAFNIIAHNPILGVGMNNYVLVAPKYDTTSDRVSVRIPDPVHNIYLLYAAEAGLLGFLMFLLFLLRTIFAYFKFPFSNDSTIWLLSRSIGIGIACCWLHGLIGWGFRLTLVFSGFLCLFSAAVFKLISIKKNNL